MIDHNKVIAAIEPVAADYADQESELLVSIAISLRRIADAMEPEIVIELPEPIVAAVEVAPATWPIELSPEEEAAAARWKKLDIVNIVRGVCTTCEQSEKDCACIPF